jgi:flagellar biosynthesis protein FliR
MMAWLVLYFTLILTRVTTFVTVFPLFGGQTLPRTVKAGLSLALTLAWFEPVLQALPTAAVFPSPSTTSAVAHVVAVGREVMLGVVLGCGLGLFMVPVQVAGEFLTQEMGLSFGNQVHAVGQGTSSPLTQILEQIAVVVFFGMDCHHAILATMHATFAQYPVWGAMPQALVPKMVDGIANAEEWGLLLAAPVGFCLLVTTAMLALLTRAAPTMNLFAVGFPIRLAVGLSACVLLMPGWVQAIALGFSRFEEMLRQWM